MVDRADNPIGRTYSVGSEEYRERVHAMIFTKADRERLERVDKNLIETSLAQGKLLAALNEENDNFDMVEGTLRNLDARLETLSGQIKGLGDGLADEIAGLHRAIKEISAREWIAGFRCAWKRAAKLPPPKPRRSQPRKRKEKR